MPKKQQQQLVQQQLLFQREHREVGLKPKQLQQQLLQQQHLLQREHLEEGQRLNQQQQLLQIHLMYPPEHKLSMCIRYNGYMASTTTISTATAYVST